MQSAELYWNYWGKSGSVSEQPRPFHLLAYHNLDVAAVAEALLLSGNFKIQGCFGECASSTNGRLFCFFLALHDLGKFARAFQGLVPGLSADLVPHCPTKHYSERHDTLGWWLWREELSDQLEEMFPGDPDVWQMWVRIAAGHHGMPPKESGGNTSISLERYFCNEDIDAARLYVKAVAALFFPEGFPEFAEQDGEWLHQYSWQLAGLTVLADWIGSRREDFQFRTIPDLSLVDYWTQIARPAARKAVSGLGFVAKTPAPFKQVQSLFDYLSSPSPLQQYATSASLGDSAQLFLLEDVTGAGKTEAALILAHRLMASGLAEGLYFALPSMATANQMYQRVGDVYNKLFLPDANPWIVLAHGARGLNEDFRRSIVTGTTPEQDYQPDEVSVSRQCSAWLADSNKKALLADVGVGTLDQALLAVLPARHQSLRLLGLSRKVLIVDEVHAYDPYMRRLLEGLLTAHARQGGCAILLSATLPAEFRSKLVDCFISGAGLPRQPLPPDMRYPLATHALGGAETNLAVEHCPTREILKRRVGVNFLHSEDDALVLIRRAAMTGACVCWIRNTVDDARRAFAVLQTAIPENNVMLFHSRYAMGHRLDIENAVLDIFGKRGKAEQRQGRVLVASQVVEQSLDLDFDVLVSDLAPVELLIQRAGRLHRHVRDADGNPAAEEGRAAPVLHVLAPEFTEMPSADWFAALFPKACFVYPNAGELWLAQRALLHAGEIVTPGEVGEMGAVRSLVEAVYGDTAEEIPDALRESSRKCLGEVLGKISMASFNSLDLQQGYCRDSSRFWGEETRIPTRLGDETTPVYLAVPASDGLAPLVPHAESLQAWALSSVKVDARKLKAMAPAWQKKYDGPLQVVRSSCSWLAEPAVILVLESGDGGIWKTMGVDAKGREFELCYNRQAGLLL